MCVAKVFCFDNKCSIFGIKKKSCDILLKGEIMEETRREKNEIRTNSFEC